MRRIKLPCQATDLTGRVFGRLSVACPATDDRQRSSRAVHWRCICECGNEALVSSESLVRGTTVSCGCNKREKAAISGANSATHGLSQTPEHKAWCKMKDRCGPQFSNWGGRGIVVCDRWRDSFEAFYADVGAKPSPKHSLDRYPNNDGNYEPGNVRWATRREQMLNKRDNFIITAFGITGPLASFFALGSKAPAYKHAHQRLHAYGWGAERAIEQSIIDRCGV